jgi:hypothetical protein
MKHSITAATITAFVLTMGMSSTVHGDSEDPLPAPDEHVLQWHWTDHDEGLAWDADGPDWCPEADFPVRFSYDAWGKFQLVNHGGEQLYGSNNFNESMVFTNLENDKTFSWASHGVDKDLHATTDANGVLSIDALEAGPVTYYDSQHRPVFREAGLFLFHVEIDTTTGEELLKTGTAYHGIDQAADRDWCATFVEYLGE